MKQTGLYIHIPFCRQKCIYCDFFSGGSAEVDWTVFISALLNEMRERRGELKSPPSSIYIGGGTPSLIPPRNLEILVEGIKDIFGLTPPYDEFTIEVNPEDVDSEIVRVWKDLGISRVSMGVQSLIDIELQAVKRRHNAEDAEKALEIISSNFTNFSCDLIFGLPRQNLESLKKSVEGVLRFDPKHISLYSLMLESNTPLTILHNQNRISLPPEEESISMWNWISAHLNNKGYGRYEISNYAKPGFEAIHNIRYWLGNPYLGIGPAAHSYDGHQIRRSNPHKIKEYIALFSAQKISGKRFYEEERLSEIELIEEFVMLRMRMKEGFSLKEFDSRFGHKYADIITKKANHMIKQGKLSFENGNLSLTNEGVMTSDDIILTLLSGL